MTQTGKQRPCEEGCPFRIVQDRLGDKWSVLIILILDEAESIRFSDLHNRIDGISLKVLSSCLRNLERDNLIVRTSYDEVPPRVEYALSVLGKDLVPYIKKLSEWAMENLSWNGIRQ